MSNLKQLKLRIAGVKSTQKITKAMKMVSASKLLKSQEQKDLAKPYANKMFEMVQNIAKSSKDEITNLPLLTGTGKNELHLLVLVSSDKGLCGSLNTSIVKKAKLTISHLISQGKKFKILFIGKRAFEQLKFQYKDKAMEIIPSFSSKKFSYEVALELSQKITDIFTDGAFDECSFIYPEFKNALKQTVVLKKLIPLSEEEVAQENNKIAYEYEPHQNEILEKMLPLNLAVQIYYIILESVASEHGARMTAMDSATNNASEMISKLTLQYNRSRQAAITKELIEIISSAEVV
jgi:F-type H+-transporting ATPase subunit gamma